MTTKNAVSWFALLVRYYQNGNYEVVLTLFREMDRGRGDYSFGIVLQACTSLVAMRPGKEIHCQFLRMSGWCDVIVESGLVDLYAKCGLIDYAYRVFTSISVKNLIKWNVMISGFAKNGRGIQAMNLFDKILRKEMRLENISFVGVLFACSHSSLVKEGRHYFKLMSQNYHLLREFLMVTVRSNTLLNLATHSSHPWQAMNFEVNKQSLEYLSLHPQSIKKQLTLFEEHFEPVMEDDDEQRISESDVASRSSEEGSDKDANNLKISKCVRW